MSDASDFMDMDILQATLIFAFCQISPLALLAYDMIITIDQEVESVWERKLTASTVLFLLTRYVYLGQAILKVTNILVTFHSTSCYANVILLYIFQVAGSSVTIAYTSLRIWAIWGRQWFPPTLILVTGLVVPCVNIFFSTQNNLVGISPLPAPYGGCEFANPGPVSLYLKLETLSRILTIVSDAIALGATWIKTIGIKRAADKAGIKAKFMELLIRDGTIYFGTLLIMHTVSLALDYSKLNLNPSGEFIDAMTSILIAHMILNLRDVSIDANASDTVSSHLVFALGNIGAPLINSSDSTPLSDSEIDRVIRVSAQQWVEDPLAIGILHINEPEAHSGSRDIEEPPLNDRDVD